MSRTLHKSKSRATQRRLSSTVLHQFSIIEFGEELDSYFHKTMTNYSVLNKAKKHILSIFFIAFYINLSAQLLESDEYRLSLSWTPIVCFVDEGNFTPHILPVDVESLIHYKPFGQYSFASGFGYQRSVISGPGFSIASSVIEEDLSYKWITSEYRFPLQFHYHFMENPSKSDVFLTVEFINNVLSDKMIHYEDDIRNSVSAEFYYRPLMSIGLGSFFKTEKAIGIRIEGGLETYLRKNMFARSYQIKMGIGIVF